jgi:transcriptional regulator with XRE-family HTH domain
MLLRQCVASCNIDPYMTTDLIYSPEKITQLRIAKGLNKSQLADAAGVSHVTIMKYERGNVIEPKYETLLDIAKGLGVSVQAILAEKQNPDLDDNLAQTISGLSGRNKAALLGAAIKLLKEQQ